MPRRFLPPLPNPELIRQSRWLRPFQDSLRHAHLWRLTRHSAAGGVAVGLFCGLIPGPLQMIAAACAAMLLRVHLPLALFVTLYTNPLTIVPLYVLAYRIGRFIVADHSRFVSPPDIATGTLAAWSETIEAWMLDVAEPLAVGLIVLACTLAVVGYVTTYALWGLYLRTVGRRSKRL